MKTFDITCSYLVPQSYRGFVEAEDEEDAIAQMMETAKKQGFIAFRADRIEEADLSSREGTYPKASSPGTSTLN